MILRKSIERLRNCEVAVQSPILAEKLTCYAGILAAEGSLTTAMTYLPENSDQVRSTFFPPPTLESILLKTFCLNVLFLLVSFFLLSLQPGIRMLRDRLFHAQTEAVQNRVGGSTSKTTAAQVPAPKAQVMV